MPAVFHFHVAKTAGHSLINEIRQHFVPSQILTERGRVTVPFLQACGDERLRDAGFIYGHTGTGQPPICEASPTRSCCCGTHWIT